MTTLIGPGTFIAVTGASGVGKDTLLDAARERCSREAYFPRRVITRRVGPGEDYASVDDEEFLIRRDRGEFAVCWQAHGLHYGIPVSADNTVHAGGVVVANVSRGVIDKLLGRYEHVVTVRITVSDSVRAERLRARERESSDGIARRLARLDPAAGRIFDHEIRNDTTVEAGARSLIHIIGSAIGREIGVTF